MPHKLRPLALIPLLCSQAFAQASPPAADIKSFQQLEDKWSIAYAGRDQYGMELLLSPMFIDISAAGKVNGRNGVLAAMVSGLYDGAQLVSLEQKAVDLHLLGDGAAAVVDGTYVVHYKAAVAGAETKGAAGGASTIDERGVFSQVWQRTRGGWACTHAQRTAVFDEPVAEGKAHAASAKKSNAELPFHVPLVYGGAQSTKPAPKPGDVPPPPQ